MNNNGVLFEGKMHSILRLFFFLIYYFLINEIQQILCEKKIEKHLLSSIEPSLQSKVLFI